MSMSLREQLLAAGLGTKKQAREADRQERQTRHKPPRGDTRGAPRESEQQQRAAQAQAEKAARDRALNLRRQEQAERKARWAQIKQLVEQHRLAKPDSEEYFNFIDREKVRRVVVDEPLRQRLIAGSVAIVRCEGRYDFLPPEVAERIRALEPRALVSLGADAQPAPEQAPQDDPYKDFVVPDDLKW